MPKRVIDFDALWASDKIASCPAWAQAEYAWLYGLADASGSFELTNLRVVWGRVAAIRKDLTIERLEQVFQEFIARGVLFTWETGGKRYGHWTGSDVPGRLPPPSWRARLERLAPPVPKQQLAAYTSRFSSRREPTSGDENARGAIEPEANGPAESIETVPAQLKLGLEATQGQEWNRDWRREEEIQDTPVCDSVRSVSENEDNEMRGESIEVETNPTSPEQLLEIYQSNRGSLPPAAGLTPERRRQCRRRVREGLSCETFAEVVRRAAATPFLTGEGARGWRANFDWLMASDTNMRKVIEGAYDSTAACGAAQGGSRARGLDRALYSEIHVGTGPIAAQSGARVKPEVLKRVRAREAARCPP
jgi:hypothetical protein